VELRTNCRVREITVGPDGMATGAIYYDRDGQEVFQPAHVVVMAANGIGTPRLLLNSKSERFPNGLANSSDLVGRNLMLHPWPVVQGWFHEEMDGQRGPIVSLWSKQFYETDLSRGFTRGYMLQFGRGPGPVGEAQAGLESGRMPWGEGPHAAMRRYHPRRRHNQGCRSRKRLRTGAQSRVGMAPRGLLAA
jgi:choline dehydrogenase-like flavoprotein